MRRSSRLTCLAQLFALAALACSSEPPSGTGGTDVAEQEGETGESCGRGVAVLMTDYTSSNVALLDLQGETKSGSFVSSGSTDVLLSAPLSGDVTFPSSRMADEIVLLDRFPASVLSFVDVTTAEVTQQVPVRTGFDANPQDYLALDDGRALVSRFEKNTKSGEQDFDEGDDLLVINSVSGELVGRVDFSPWLTGEQRARPAALVQAGGQVLVTLTGHDSSFTDAEPARIAVLDVSDLSLSDEIAVKDMKSCSGLAVSPSGARLAVACSGLVDSSNDSAPPWSGVVVFERDGSSWSESARFPASDLGWGPFAFRASFASENQILTATYGALDGPDKGRPDRLVVVDLTDNQAREVLRSDDSAPEWERAFVLGGVQCVPGCQVCFAADAGRRVVHRWDVQEGEWGAPTEHVVDTTVALPPRRLGWF